MSAFVYDVRRVVLFPFKAGRPALWT